MHRFHTTTIKRSDKSPLWNPSCSTILALALTSKQNKHKQSSEKYTHKQQMKGSSMSNPSSPLFSEGLISPSILFPSSRISEQSLESTVFFLHRSSAFLLKDLKGLGYGGRGGRPIWGWCFCFWNARRRSQRNSGARRRGLPWKWEEEWLRFGRKPDLDLEIFIWGWIFMFIFNGLYIYNSFEYDMYKYLKYVTLNFCWTKEYKEFLTI